MTIYNNTDLSAKNISRLNDPKIKSGKFTFLQGTKLLAIVVITALISIVNVSITTYQQLTLDKQKTSLEEIKQENLKLQENLTAMITQKASLQQQLDILSKETTTINAIKNKQQNILEKQKKQINTVTNNIVEHKKHTEKKHQDIKKQLQQLSNKLDTLINKSISELQIDLANMKSNSLQIDTALSKTKDLDNQILSLRANLKNKLTQIENSIRALYKSNDI